MNLFMVKLFVSYKKHNFFLVFNKMILFVENYKIFQNWASKTYPFKCQALKDDPRIDTYDFGNSLRNINCDDYETIIFGWHGIPINKYYTRNHAFYSNYIEHLEDEETVNEIIEPLITCNKIKKYIMVQDLHNEDYKDGLKGLISYLNKYNINGIITPYKNTKNINTVLSATKNLKVIWIPHHIDTQYFKNYNQEKKYDVLLYGNDNTKYYSFRNRVIKLLLEEGKNNGIIVHRIPRPRNYFRYNAAISNANLSKLISRSRLTLCTSSCLDYLLGKYFETSFSGSVILGNMPEDGKQIWKNNYVHIDNNMSDNQIIETISNALNDEELLKTISSNMYKVMISNFPLSSFVDHLCNQL